MSPLTLATVTAAPTAPAAMLTPNVCAATVFVEVASTSRRVPARGTAAPSSMWARWLLVSVRTMTWPEMATTPQGAGGSEPEERLGEGRVDADGPPALTRPVDAIPASVERPKLVIPMPARRRPRPTAATPATLTMPSRSTARIWASWPAWTLPYTVADVPFGGAGWVNGVDATAPVGLAAVTELCALAVCCEAPAKTLSSFSCQSGSPAAQSRPQRTSWVAT